MIHRDDIHLIETHLRMGGDYIPELLGTSYGVDLPALTAQWIVCGSVEPAVLASLPDEAETHSVIRYLSAEKHGTIEAFEGVDEALLQPGILAIELFFTPGDQVRPAEQSGDRLAAVRACASSAELAHRYARGALDLLRVSYSVSSNGNQSSLSSISSSDAPSALEEVPSATR